MKCDISSVVLSTENHDLGESRKRQKVMLVYATLAAILLPSSLVDCPARVFICLSGVLNVFGPLCIFPGVNIG